jgi:hypothetical protein
MHLFYTYIYSEHHPPPPLPLILWLLVGRAVLNFGPCATAVSTQTIIVLTHGLYSQTKITYMLFWRPGTLADRQIG